jgi:hypothetical protein
MKKTIMIISAACITMLTFGQSKGDITTVNEKVKQHLPREMKLMIASFGTVESQTEVEQWLSDLLHPQTLVENESQKDSIRDRIMGYEGQFEALAIDWNTKAIRYFRTENEVHKENARRMRVLTNLKMDMLSDAAKRYTQLARDYLQAAIKKEQGGRLIKIVDRGNMTIQQTEKHIRGDTIELTNGADCILSVVLGDQEKNSKIIPIDMAGTKINRTTYTAPYVGKIRDLNGNILHAFNGTAQISQTTDNIVESALSNPTRRLIEKVCENISKEVMAFFTVKLDFRIKVPEGFDVDDAVIYVDGREVDNNCVQVLSCDHLIQASLEGCHDIVRTVKIEEGQEGKTVRLKFKKNNK